MRQEFIPANRSRPLTHHETRLITYHVSYVEKHVGYDNDFNLQAQSTEHLIDILTALFPGRGDFTFFEVQ